MEIIELKSGTLREFILICEKFYDEGLMYLRTTNGCLYCSAKSSTIDSYEKIAYLQARGISDCRCIIN